MQDFFIGVCGRIISGVITGIIMILINKLIKKNNHLS